MLPLIPTLIARPRSGRHHHDRRSGVVTMPVTMTVPTTVADGKDDTGTQGGGSQDDADEAFHD